MGNACGCGRGRDPRVEESSRAIRSADAACTEMGLRRRMGEQGRYIRRTRKWTFGVIDDDAADRRFRLEMLEAPIEDVQGGNWKWLQGDHFMPFRSYARRHDYCCFLYETMGNVREHISERRMALGRDREQVIAAFLPAIFAGLKDLGYLNLHHTALSWDAIEIDAKNKARFGSLEYLVDGRKAESHDLADIRHLPPESLRACHTSRRARTPEDLAKREVWIIGSLLLEIMLHKHVSGSEFVLSRTRPSRRVALRNIRRNVPRMTFLLESTTLSPRMQELLKQMLIIDVRGRMSLDQAINVYSGRDSGSKGIAHVDEPVRTTKVQATAAKRLECTEANRPTAAYDLGNNDGGPGCTDEPARTKKQQDTGGKRFLSCRKKKEDKTTVATVEQAPPPSRRPARQQRPTQKKKEKEPSVDEPVNETTQERTYEPDADESSESEGSKHKFLSDCFRCKSSRAQDEVEPGSDTRDRDGEASDDACEREEAKGLVVAARRYLNRSKETNTNIVAASDGRPGSPNVVISIKFTSPDKQDVCETTKTINLGQIQQHEIEKATDVRHKEEEARYTDSCTSITDTDGTTLTDATTQDNRYRPTCMKPRGERKSSSAPPSPISGSSSIVSSVITEVKNIDVKSDLYEIPHSADVSSIYTTEDSVSKIGRANGDDAGCCSPKSASADRRSSTTDHSSTVSSQPRCEVSSQQSGSIHHYNKKPQKYTSNVRYDARYNVTTINKK